MCCQSIQKPLQADQRMAFCYLFLLSAEEVCRSHSSVPSYQKSVGKSVLEETCQILPLKSNYLFYTEFILQYSSFSSSFSHLLLQLDVFQYLALLHLAFHSIPSALQYARNSFS